MAERVIRFEKDIHTALWGHEEWLVSALPSAPSRVVEAEGQALRVTGKTLHDICPGFPLMAKKIVAEKRLSVQVHPNVHSVKWTGGDAKTEMWCVLRPGPIFAGFKKGVTREDVKRAIVDGGFEDLLVRFEAKPGECYLIPGGLVHAIGEGTVVYEIQQTSVTNLRLYDWGRVDADGRPRPLHIEEGLMAMNVSFPPPVPSDSVKCPYFEFYKARRDQGSGIGDQAEGETPWRIVYVPTADDCFLLPPDSDVEIPTGAWVTIVGCF